MRGDRVIVIGAGMGGLAAALDLASEGVEVTVLERAARPGGKVRQVAVGGALVDAGPTVLTMRWVFEDLFARAGSTLADHLPLRPAETLARHRWPDGSQLDLYADLEKTVAAIDGFAGSREADGYRRFAADARRIYQTLRDPFICDAKPNLPQLIARVAATTPLGLWHIQPYTPLWRALGRYFRDQRLRQLFARYATYCGSSPFDAPATLMLVAHVESEGVWLVEGGMQMLAERMAALAGQNGCTIRYGAHVEEILVAGGRACGVRLANGERIPARAVICNADVAAVASGAFGASVSAAAALRSPSRRSLSAMTWAMLAEGSGAPLIRHNVFFSDNYAREFNDIFTRRRPPRAPTIYVCAQDRDARDRPHIAGPERLFCVMNAPATGDGSRFDQGEIERCADSMFETFNRCGLTVRPKPDATIVTTPADFHRAFPQTGGALYGPSSHGWMASFRRASARSRIPGLYFAGGSVHPGAGLPMAALSGRLASMAVQADSASQKRFRPVAMPGGMSTA